MSSRIYLDWNATAPLRPEAREAMLAAMDVVGNPSSVHAEGRAARGIVEKARGQVAALVGCEPSEVVFTSGATEAASFIDRSLRPAPIEVLPGVVYESFCYVPESAHDCLHSHRFVSERDDRLKPGLGGDTLAMGVANSETGVIEKPMKRRDGSWWLDSHGPAAWLVLDAVQAIGRIEFDFRRSGAQFAIVSSHKIGGPVGSGCLICESGKEFRTNIRGGGQEMGRRAGTENVIGIAGFGAAAEAAQRDLESGVWERVAKLRDDLEHALVSAAPDIIIFGKDAPRLPNTSCFAVPGWKGETQVMQMDLAGFAISSGSACSSGKVGPSRVLRAMGYDETTASSAIRVSMGPTTTEAEVMAFAETWTDFYRRRRAAA